MATLSELWNILRAEPSSSNDGISLRMRSESFGLRLYAGLERFADLPSILLDISKDSRPKEWSRVSTQAFVAETVTISGLSNGRMALSITLKNKEYEDLFILLGEDLVQAVEGSPSEATAVRSVVRRIDRWRKFLERGKKHLTAEEVRGLLGELIVLARCIAQYGAKKSLDAWQHDGGLRDFEFPSMAIEVKTHQAATGTTVRISDLMQLESAAGRPLYLATIQLSLVENAGWSLPMAVNRVNDFLADDYEAGEQFWDSLAAQGYFPTHASHYPEQYLVSSVQSFLVSDGFPRIISSAVPLGVEAVAFSIRLAAMWQFKVEVGQILGAESVLG